MNLETTISKLSVRQLTYIAVGLAIVFLLVIYRKQVQELLTSNNE